jgi:hypothetical protein
MLEHPELTGPYNAGFENISAMDTAMMIAEEVEAKINITQVKDKRSYAVDSSKLLNTGFKPRYGVRHAIKEIASSGLEPNDSMMNLKWMQQHGWVSETR